MICIECEFCKSRMVDKHGATFEYFCGRDCPVDLITGEIEIKTNSESTCTYQRNLNGYFPPAGLCGPSAAYFYSKRLT